MREDEPFSNPIAPAGHQAQQDEKDESKPLSNDDFRKLVMSTRGGPSVHSGGGGGGGGGGGATERKSGGGVLGMGHSVRGMRMGSSSGSSTSAGDKAGEVPGSVRSDRNDRDAVERRKKKKAQYLQLKKMEMDKEAELAAKYRDRAKERRDVSEKEDAGEEASSSTTQNYRAVAPGAKEGESDERRNRIIQESKFLGGDMEHTHLVKGLDYALLQKVKAEISNKEQTLQDEDLDNIIENMPSAESKEKPGAATAAPSAPSTSSSSSDDQKSHKEIKSTLARNIHRVLFDKTLPERNELFAPGRMAYVVDLEDEFGESDVPTTVIRSKTDCPDVEATATLSANDIVIQKLTQILSYLRQGHRGKKLKKKMLAKDEGKILDPAAEEGIFGSSEFAMPQQPSSSSKGAAKAEKNDDKGKDSRDKAGPSRWDDKDKKKVTKDESGRFSYFDKPSKDDAEEEFKAPAAKNAAEMIKTINAKYAEYEKPEEAEKAKKLLKKQNTDCYTECYPGMDDDHNYDSDEEADFTKMDQGNKKGPVGRWDFDTQEEYGEYMSSREALPKAAFQFGVKMADGRKTRRVKGGQNEKQKLDREWQQISKLIDKRKEGGQGGGDRKKVKY